MNDKTASQPQHDNAFKTAIDEQMARVEAMTTEFTKLESKTFAQMQNATNETMKLWAGSFEYGTQLAADFRKLAVEVTRRAFDLTSPKL